MFEKLGQLGDRVQNEFDRWQQRIRVLAFPISVWLRYREDRCYEYAALLSYYGFFSIFPLLAAGVTILGFILAGNPELRAEVLDTIFARIPVVGEALVSQIDGLEGNGIVLIVAIGFALWAGIGVVRGAQNAFNTMWSVSIMRWPSFIPKLLRALVVVVVIGSTFLVATVLSSLVTFGFDVPGIQRFVGVVLAMVVNAFVLLIVFKLLTVSEVGWRSLIPGALAGGVGLWLLQLLGGVYVEGVVLGAGAVYGSFAMTVGLLVWLSLVARVVLLAAEVNVVATKHLWPRSFTGGNLTEADERSFDEVRTRSVRKLEQSATPRTG
ncbi:MAG: YihY/virulence factor BrkB family protein [Acidimicrobiia bacterium]